MNPEIYTKRLHETVSHLERSWGAAPSVALILGSGLGDFMDDLPDRRVLPYAEVPNFPISKVVGHAGQLTLASHESGRFVAMQGRVHFYEGWPPEEVVYHVRALALWGVQRFVITNAAGAVNTDFSPGELMAITDHLNLLGDNPLCGDNLDHLGERFPDMTTAYSPRMRSLLVDAAARNGTVLREGVYAAVKGPCYETPAEIRMLRVIGADAVGMSTVPEVIALNHAGREVLGISCITNMAAGILDEPMRHEDVLETTIRVRKDFSRLIQTLLGRLI